MIFLNFMKSNFISAKVGETIKIKAPHRDMSKDKVGDCYFLPDRAEPPRTFSLKQTITDVLNSVCPQAPDNMEELPEEVQQALSNESEGQNMWKFVDMKIEDNYIIITVKKL